MRILAVVALTAILLLAFSVGYGASSRFQLASETSRPVLGIACVEDEATREKIRAIMLEAVEQSLREHIVRLTDSWMKDDTGQPQRAINGATRGIKAFIGSRSQALKWNPPLCQ